MICKIKQFKKSYCKNNSLVSCFSCSSPSTLSIQLYLCVTHLSEHRVIIPIPARLSLWSSDSRILPVNIITPSLLQTLTNLSASTAWKKCLNNNQLYLSSTSQGSSTFSPGLTTMLRDLLVMSGMYPSSESSCLVSGVRIYISVGLNDQSF